MTGKTHIAVGAAAALAVAKYVPAALTAGVPTIAGSASTLACLAAGAAGGLLPDTDVSTSEASRQLRRAWWLLVAVIAATFAADALLGLDLGVQTVAFARTAGVYQVAGVAVVVAVLACGRASGHRGFSHSLVAAALFFAGAYLAVRSTRSPNGSSGPFREVRRWGCARLAASWTACFSSLALSPWSLCWPGGCKGFAGAGVGSC